MFMYISMNINIHFSYQKNYPRNENSSTLFYKFLFKSNHIYFRKLISNIQQNLKKLIRYCYYQNSSKTKKLHLKIKSIKLHKYFYHQPRQYFKIVNDLKKFFFYLKKKSKSFKSYFLNLNIHTKVEAQYYYKFLFGFIQLQI